jgi:hypothetical protein
MPSRPDRPAEPETGMFGRLRAACADEWAAYT